jgi:cephalosporin hydroxylase
LDQITKFKNEREERIRSYENDVEFLNKSSEWNTLAFYRKYMYNFEVMGRPIIQLPSDIVAIQEIIWEVKPDLIIETGIAHGGSLILNASALALLDYCEAIEQGTLLDPKKPKRRVLGIDIDIREHNRKAIEEHPLSNRIDMIQGSSVDQDIIDKVHEIASHSDCILVCLDSNHTQEHVLAELEAYAPLTTRGSYCIVLDTVIENLPDDMFSDRPWSVGNSPMTAIQEYLKLLHENNLKACDETKLEFEVDQLIDRKLMVTAAPGGYLKRV